jgi:hypothetical protein
MMASPTILPSGIPAPRRCFFADIPGILAQEAQSKKEEVGKRSTQLRLMGELVSVVNDSQQHEEENLSEGQAYSAIQLDDGTGVASIWTEASMLKSIQWSLGCTMECICRMDRGELIAQVVCVIDDPHQSIVRSLELTYLKRKQQQGLDAEIVNYRGHPVRSLDSEDVFGAIQSAQEYGGISRDDLQFAYRRRASLQQIDDMILELQLSGQIYLNSQQKFVPL